MLIYQNNFSHFDVISAPSSLRSVISTSRPTILIYLIAEDHIAKFYEISEYREQYKYSLVPVLLDDLEPDGFTKPPPHGPSRGRPVCQRPCRAAA